MAPDKYDAVWLSHSSIGDYLKCPRAYFLRNVYKNEKGHKINLMAPALSLGIAVHNAIEDLKNYKAEDRFKKPLDASFEEEWKKVTGKLGGFKTAAEETEAKERGKLMIERVVKNPGLLLKKTVKLKEGHNGMPPNFYLSEEENLILCGKIDWLEYQEQDDSVRVIDFKTGRNEESGDSLQLPIYALLLNALQKRKVSGGAYWYLESGNIVPVVMPDIKESKEKVLSIARMIKQARQKNEFACPRGTQGCFSCRPFEKILQDQAEYIGLDNQNRELYLV